MNSYYLEWQSRRGEDHPPDINRGLNELHPTDSRISFASLGRKSGEHLSKIVWDINHIVDDTTSSSHPTTRPPTKFTEYTTASGRQSSYELELLNRRLDILGNGFLESGADSWIPIEVIVTPASSDLLDPEFLDDSSLEVTTSPERKKFFSLRGLPGFRSTRGSSFAGDILRNNISHKSACTQDENTDCYTFFATTAEDQEESYLSNKEKMTEVKNKEFQTLIVPGPWIEKSGDKSTSPYQREEDDKGTIKVLKTQSKGTQFRQAPHYPFETGRPSKGRKLNRPTIHNGLLRTRLHDYSHPAVVSSTQQLLCLTPSRSGVITLGSNDDVKALAKPTESNKVIAQVKRFNEKENSPLSLAATVVTKTSTGDQNTYFRLKQREGSSRAHMSTAHGHPFALANLHYKHTSQIRKPYRYPSQSHTVITEGKHENASKMPTFERNATAMSMTKHPPSTAYRIIESHLKWNRRLPAFQQDEVGLSNVYPYPPSFYYHNPAAQARKMAPVLRVVPAFPRAPKAPTSNKPPKSPVVTEPASQKKVRFSDQLGLPLVRNATPNYRRKHSYILRWLETAGRPAKSIPLA